jgi:PadR family transcriptional regulator, regulatory protein PadR
MTELLNWKTQIKKGYLELCTLLIIQKHDRLYGFDLIEKLKAKELDLKEGTLYPLLNRLTQDGILKPTWETEGIKGHPRKFYSLTKEGTRLVESMREEYDQMIDIYRHLKK